MTLANAKSVNAQMLENVMRKPASTDLRGELHQRKRLHLRFRIAKCDCDPRQPKAAGPRERHILLLSMDISA